MQWKNERIWKNNLSKKLIKIFFQLSVVADPIHDDRNVVFFMILRSLLLLNTGWLLYKAVLNIFMISLLINIFLHLQKKEFACKR